ncbi:hypothetical protein HanOQP8_Chr17g0669591 [Helianthus annuus]|nr:hypothetical protein HanIR_Chr17g0884461 [Helianthus annuus]KAJ0637084.1 hypothetical protein HanOQP8_Chr17g0669591 [Helianthus annuus]
MRFRLHECVVPFASGFAPPRLLDLMQNCVYSIDLLFTYCVPNWVRTSDSHVGLGWCARVDYIMVNRNKQFQDNRCFCCIYRWRNR